jgi:DNA-binding IscR family transcriptional regulator
MVATRFAVALHILLLLVGESDTDATSSRLAVSIGTNPVVVRRIAGLLVRAGLIVVQRGPGGATLARPADAITLRDVWQAVHPPNQPLLRVHARTSQEDPVGRRVPGLLRQRFDQAEVAMLDDMARTTLADLAMGLRRAEGAAARG